MKKISYYVTAGLVAGLLFTLTNCKKQFHEGKLLVMTSPVIDRNQTIREVVRRTFNSEKEFTDYIKNGLSSLKLEKLPAIRKRLKSANSYEAQNIDETDINPCPVYSPNGDVGGHVLNETVQTSNMFNSLMGFSLGLSLNQQYYSDGSSISVNAAAAAITGTSAPTSQSCQGNVYVNGTTISNTGSITATWSTTTTTSTTSSGTSSTSTSSGYTVTTGPFTANSSGGGSYSSTMGTTTTTTSTVNTTALISYAMNEDICTGTGNLKVWVNGSKVYDGNY